MTPLHRPRVQRWLRGHLLCHAERAGSRFALTFDDGPSPRNTPRLLEVLARHDARATFFVMRSALRRHPDLARRVLEAGHEIGVHCDWHLPASTMPPAWLAHDIRGCLASIRDVLGITPRHYRAPFGLLFPFQSAAVEACGLTPVLGDIYPRDHSERTPEPIVARVVERLGAGSIVILHDASALWNPDRSATVAAVDGILEAATRQGLRSVTVAELRDPNS